MLLGQAGPHDGAQLVRVPGHHQLAQLRLEDPGDGDGGLWLGGLASLVDEDVSEVSLRREMLTIVFEI